MSLNAEQKLVSLASSAYFKVSAVDLDSSAPLSVTLCLPAAVCFTYCPCLSL